MISISASGEFQNRDTSKLLNLVSLWFRSSPRTRYRQYGELRNRDTRLAAHGADARRHLAKEAANSPREGKNQGVLDEKTGIGVAQHDRERDAEEPTDAPGDDPARRTGSKALGDVLRIEVARHGRNHHFPE